MQTVHGHTLFYPKIELNILYLSFFFPSFIRLTLPNWCRTISFPEPVYRFYHSQNLLTESYPAYICRVRCNSCVAEIFVSMFHPFNAGIADAILSFKLWTNMLIFEDKLIINLFIWWAAPANTTRRPNAGLMLAIIQLIFAINICDKITLLSLNSNSNYYNQLYVYNIYII